MSPQKALRNFFGPLLLILLGFQRITFAQSRTVYNDQGYNESVGGLPAGGRNNFVSIGELEAWGYAVIHNIFR